MKSLDSGRGEKMLVKNAFVRKGKIGNQVFLINGRQCFELNEIGVFIWEAFDSPISIEDVIDRVANEFEISTEERNSVEKDIRNYINNLLEFELVYEE